MNAHLVIGAFVLTLLLTIPCFAQEPIIYPAKGQSQRQTDKDKYECYSWAKQQTGFDPVQAPKQQPQASGKGSTAMRGAAGGAALGAAGGAIAGDAGKGAAIGAATGGVIGGVRGRRERQQQAQARNTQAAAHSQEQGGYNRAFGACMEGRGYTVK
ncbi:MAG: hypothetical protein A4E57_02817 [Syntrophorhabdaceae bacterium PtaU1.Bin034]|nr:MAG: hypothetical protein A4E57_02817 [Syntrophorhabdaceae bacterium PtaU1.Bin034]